MGRQPGILLVRKSEARNFPLQNQPVWNKTYFLTRRYPATIKLYPVDNDISLSPYRIPASIMFSNEKRRRYPPDCHAWINVPRPEDDNPFAKYNYTRRKRQSDVWLRLAKIGGVVLFLGVLFLLYKSNSFRGRTVSSGAGTHKSQHNHSHDKIQRENATLVMLVR